MKEKVVQLYELLLEHCSRKTFENEPDAAASELPESFWHELFLIKANRGFWDGVLSWGKSPTSPVAGVPPAAASYSRETIRMALHMLTENALHVMSGGEPQLSTKPNVETASSPEGDQQFTNEPPSPIQDAISQLSKVRALETFRCVFEAIVGSPQVQTFGYDVPDLLVGIANVDRIFQMVVRTIVKCLKEESAEDCVAGAALQLLCSILTATDNLNQNMFYQYFMDASVLNALLQIHACGVEDSAQVAMAILSLLFNYRKYEVQNVLLGMTAEYASEMLTCFLMAQKMLDSFISELVPLSETYSNSTASSQSSVYQSIWTTFGSLFTGNFVSAKAEGSVETTFVEKINPLLPGTLLCLYEVLFNDPNFVQILFSSTEGHHFLTAFVKFSAILFQCPGSRLNHASCTLCLLMFVCMMERHDMDSLPNFELQLLHRKSLTIPVSHAPHSFSYHVLDVVALFMVNNMRKKFPTDDYCYSLTIVEHVVYFLRKTRQRLAYHWNTLYVSMMRVLHYAVSHWIFLVEQRQRVDVLVEKAVSIFNTIITNGDAFLPDTISYDSCYYEIIRGAEIFFKIQTLMEADFPAVKLDLANILGICHHFLPKIQGKENAMTPELVLSIIRANYETLELKVAKQQLQRPAAYRESPMEMNFFRHITRLVIKSLQMVSGDERGGADKGEMGLDSVAK